MLIIEYPIIGRAIHAGNLYAIHSLEWDLPDGKLPQDDAEAIDISFFSILLITHYCI